MKAMTRFIGLLALLLLPVAFATADVTYEFNFEDTVSPVSALVYSCLNSQCSQVGAQVPVTQLAPNKILVNYPSVQASAFGYAEFFTAKGYRPLEGRHNWFGDGSATERNTFTKYPNVCRANVNDVRFVRELAPNRPLVVDLNTALSAETRSAFDLINNNVEFIPASLLQEFYGANSRVSFQILQNGIVIHSQVRDFTAKNGNAILANSSVPVSFTYIPTVAGTYEVRVVGEVIDDACKSFEPSFAGGEVSVLADEPVGQCYSLLNNLRADDTRPDIGDEVSFTFKKITNFADSTGALSAMYSRARYVVTDASGAVVKDTTETLVPNVDSVSESTHSFNFTPVSAGVHTVKVTLDSAASQCTAQSQVVASQNLKLDVQGESDNVVMFNVYSDKGSALVQASVVLGSTSVSTGVDGSAVVSVSSGSYNYEVSKKGFSTKRGSINVQSDLTLSVILNDNGVNFAPRVFDSSLNLIQGVSKTLDLKPLVDDEDRDDQLVFNISNSTNFLFSISNGVLTVTPGAFTGTERVAVVVKDTTGLSSMFYITLNVGAVNTAPFIVDSFITGPNTVSLHRVAYETTHNGIPEDSYRTINFNDVVLDNETAFSDLNVSIVRQSPLGVASVDSNNVVTLSLVPDVNGADFFTVRFSDGDLFIDVNVTFAILGVNDAPVVYSIPKVISLNESQMSSIDLSKVFIDVDDASLTFTNSTVDGLSFVFDNAAQVVNVSVAPNVFGMKEFGITATDAGNSSATAFFKMDVSFVNDAPSIGPVVPNVTIDEEMSASLFLSLHENDPEVTTKSASNTLTWSLQYGNQSGLVINGSLFTATLNSSTEELVVVGKLDAVGSELFSVILTDGQFNVSQDINVTINNINDAPVITNISNQNAEAGVLFNYIIGASDADGDVLTWSSNSSLFTMATVNSTNGSISFTPAVNGVFPISVQVCDASNCTNGTFTLSITDNSSPMFSNFVDAVNTVYAQGANYTFSVDVSDNGNISNVSLNFNGTIVNATNVSGTYSANISDLAAGLYSYTWTAIDGAGNSNTSASRNFTVSKALSNVSISRTFVNSTTDELNASLITPVSGTVRILVNGTQIASGASPLIVNHSYPDAGLYNVTVVFDGDQNYSANSSELLVLQPDVVVPVFGSESISPSSPASFTSLYQFNRSVTDNVGVTSVSLEIDGVNSSAVNVAGDIWQVNVSSLTVGNHSFKWYASDLAGNVANTSNSSYVVVAGTPSMSVTLNGVDGATSVPEGSDVDIVATLTVPSTGTVTLYVDGVSVASGSSPLSHTETFATAGVFNITAEFSGDANVSAGNFSRLLTVTPPITKSGFSPVNNSVLNFSSTSLSFTTSASTSCAWSLSDVNQQNMTNSFTGTTSHSGTVSGLVLGSNTVFVACNNETAGNNSELTFDVQNILDGSTITSSTINNTVGTSSSFSGSTVDDSNFTIFTITDSTLTNVSGNSSTITNSTLSDCVVVNSTVIDTTGSDCSFTNAFVDPSDITGSTIVNSNVVNSIATFSTITNSQINDSNLTNSTFTDATLTNVTGNGTITNSTLLNTVISDATITNNVISAGTLVMSNGTVYDAGVSGSASVSDLVNVAPVAVISQSSSSISTGSSVQFNASSSSDLNVGGLLNDSLSFFWDFGDGSNSTDVAPLKTFSSAGSFTITLTVTDSFNVSSVVTSSVSVSSPSSPSSGSSGGGGGGGGGASGGGSLASVDITSGAVRYDVRLGQPVQIKLDGKALALSVVLHKITENRAFVMVNGQSILLIPGKVELFDLSKDGVEDVAISVISTTRVSAVLEFKSPSQVAVVPSLGGFFNILPSDGSESSVSVPEPVSEVKEVVVPVEASIEGPSVLSSLLSKLSAIKASLSPDSVVVKIIVGLLVFAVGFLAFWLFKN